MATHHILGVTMKSSWSSDDEETIVAGTGTDFQADANCQGLWLVDNGTETESETNVCTATTGTAAYDMTYAGGGWANAVAPVGTTAGYNAVEFDTGVGAAEHFIATDAAGELNAFEAAEFTVGMWINKDLSAANEAFFSKDDATAWEAMTTATDQLRAEVENAAEISAIDLLAVGDWHHIALRRSTATGTTEIFIDGVDVCAGGCVNAGAPTGNANPITIGAVSPGLGSDFDGQAMEVIYLDRAATDLEIQEMFLCGADGTADGTLRDLAYGGATCDDINDACCNDSR